MTPKQGTARERIRRIKSQLKREIKGEWNVEYLCGLSRALKIVEEESR